MTTRRSFLTSIAATAAAPGAALSCPAQPAAVFDWWRDTLLGDRQAQMVAAKLHRDAMFWALNGVYGKPGMAALRAHREALVREMSAIPLHLRGSAP